MTMHKSYLAYQDAARKRLAALKALDKAYDEAEVEAAQAKYQAAAQAERDAYAAYMKAVKKGLPGV